MIQQIIKRNGEEVPFDAEKVRASILRTGAKEETVRTVLEEVQRRIKPKTTTQELFRTVRQELRRKTPGTYARYNLREAIFPFGPTRFPF